MFQISQKITRRAAVLCTVVLSISCDGNSTPSDEPISQLPTDEKAAARFLTQATFGTNQAEVTRVRTLGIEEWIDDQFTKTGTSHLTYLEENDGSTSDAEGRINKWWLDAIDGEDQLRARVAFALSEIFVVSDVQQTLGNAHFGLANYYDMLREHAFGNYRDLLEDVTLSPVMGMYLSMLQNAKADPATNTRADENFAREVMQLFSIGLHELNIDGTQRLVDGNPVATYSLKDVAEYARVYTGWGYADSNRWDADPLSQYANFLKPMVPYPEYHDTGEKQLLNGIVVPAGQSAEADLEIALDSLFNHPNVGPFISKQLIQRLVTSNPSPAYVSRVALTFNDNGSGERGDMQAVVKAILVDEEARYGHESNPDFGKIREPLLRMTHLWRAFNAQFAEGATTYTTNAPQLKNTSATIGQLALGAPSVFNFFHPDYAPLGTIRNKGLVAPESEIYTENYILSTNRYINTYIHKFYNAGEDAGGVRFLTYLDVRPQVNTANTDVEVFLDELDLILLSGQMPTEMRVILREHMSTLPDTPEGRARRVLDAISLVMASPTYLVQK